MTLATPFRVEGKGLHTGKYVHAEFLPAKEGHGYKIERTDMEGSPTLDCLAESVVDTQRGTVLGRGDVHVSTIEHAMAALYATGIDNCLIRLDGPEMPILDGSARPFVEKITEVGTTEQSAAKDFYVVRRKMEVSGANGEHLLIVPDDHFCLTTMIAFDSQILPSQFAALERMEDFAGEIASARTFVFVREIAPLLEAGLIRGGDLDNAIVIYENEMPQAQFDQLADALGIAHRDARQLGFLNTRPLTWANEPARHKLLDICGDLAMVGRPIKGRVIATKPGHTVNNQLARLLRQDIKRHDPQAPLYDPNTASVMDVNRIRQLLPHRYPMLLVDKIVSVDGDEIVGVKNVTGNEPFFTGHFPQEPVMPGVLLVEAMAQAGGLLVLSQLDEPERWSTYFMKIDNVKFRQKVVPGDTLLFKVRLLAPVRHGISAMRGYVFVGETLVAEAEFTAQIVKNK